MNQLSRTLRVRNGFAALAPAMLVLTSLSSAQAACKVSIDDDRVSTFLADPRRILLEDPRGGANTIWLVRGMSVISTDTLRAIRSVIPKANRQQKAAIGEGLARAVGACDARDGGVARRITDAIRTASDSEVTRAFLRFYAPGSAPAALPEPDLPDRRSFRLDPGRNPKLDTKIRGQALPDPFKTY